MRKVGIVIFDRVEVLDFAGPFEVFSVSRGDEGEKLYDVSLIAEENRIIKARGNFLVQPNSTMEEELELDVLLIPGGYGTRTEMHNEKLLKWIQTQFNGLELLLSVCTGSLVLAKANLLENLSATTHHGAIKELEEVAPNTEVKRDIKYVDNGKIITSAGISAGIEMALHVVERHHGKDMAVKTAGYMEYDWSEI